MALDLLVLVLFHLPCIADRASFASVCRHWRSAVAHLSSKEAPPAQIPWLVFPSPAIGSAVTTVFCLLSGATHRIRLPADLAGAHLCGSHPGGWLAAAAHVPGGGNSMAANLFSREKVPLPSEQQLSRPGSLCPPAIHLEGAMQMLCQMEEDVLIRAITFSAAPSAAGCVAAAITCGRRPGIASYCLEIDGHGTHRWTVPKSVVVYGIEDVVYFEGGVVPGFHFINNREDISVARTSNIRTLHWFWSKVQGEEDDVFSTLPDSVYISRYLVVSRGRLLMVRRYFTWSGSDVRQTLLFRVFECQIKLLHHHGFEIYSWVELEGLDGRALFLGRGCSRACELPQNNGIKEGSIYFIDDVGCNESLKMQDSSRFNCMDMGVYSMQEPESPSLTAATWRPDSCSSLFGAHEIVACIKHQGELEIKLFENLKELVAYVEDRTVEVEIKGTIQRFMSEPSSKGPPAIWFFH
ncbi:hypothetical protein GQ55_5G292200 [Panicum hallii var. hallii]|uniref:Uncharacterized protein n=1 Tax=Panicum hallii var. hallii TaxID=1504633 RepID=A0A2T7DLB9_9POAL|nr:hypothetical protein GQ55_5G292200 [Panicum hallii var. hallii]